MAFFIFFVPREIFETGLLRSQASGTICLQKIACCMNKGKVLLWSIIVALGGFLFGFDTAVISGAEQSIQVYWSLTPVEHGLTVSIALIGTIIGSLIGSIPADRLGK